MSSMSPSMSMPSVSSSTPSGAGSSAAGGSSASADTITISNFKYSSLSPVTPGQKVTVVNKDSTAHTVTADSGDAFDVTVPAGGHAIFAAPSKAGSYPYHCSFHPFMKATLTVK